MVSGDAAEGAFLSPVPCVILHHQRRDALRLSNNDTHLWDIYHAFKKALYSPHVNHDSMSSVHIVRMHQRTCHLQSATARIMSDDSAQPRGGPGEDDVALSRHLCQMHGERFHRIQELLPHVGRQQEGAQHDAVMFFSEGSLTSVCKVNEFYFSFTQPVSKGSYQTDTTADKSS